MIKISNPNIQQISNEYADSILKMKRRFKKDNLYLTYIFNELNFRDNIILCPPSNLIDVIESFNAKFPDIKYEEKGWRDFKNI